MRWEEEAASEVIAGAPNLTARPEREAVGFGITSYIAQAMTGSLASLADKLGVTPFLLAGWQPGQHLPQLDMLMQLCYRMGVSPLTLLVKRATQATAVVSKARTVPPLDLGQGGCVPVDIPTLP